MPFDLASALELASRAARAESVPIAALVAACQTGDRDAMAELFERCYPKVYATAVYLTGDEALAADVTQDVFVRLLSTIAQFKGASAFTTWLYRVAVNEAMDALRRRRRRTFVDLAEHVEVSGPQQAEALLRRERVRRVQAALLELSPRLRAPIVLRYVSGLSYLDVGAALGLSPGTVASRLRRAHLRLAERLQDLREEST